MNSQFSTEEKRKFRLKKHLRDHWLEYALDFVGPVLLTALVLRVCRAEEFVYGILLAIAYSAGKTLYHVSNIRKRYLDEVIQ